MFLICSIVAFTLKSNISDAHISHDFVLRNYDQTISYKKLAIAKVSHKTHVTHCCLTTTHCSPAGCRELGSWSLAIGGCCFYHALPLDGTIAVGLRLSSARHCRNGLNVRVVTQNINQWSTQEKLRKVAEEIVWKGHYEIDFVLLTMQL